MQIEIDFDVYKALTLHRKAEGHSYNDVLRDLLDLGSGPRPPTIGEKDQLASGRFFGPRFLPSNTKLRARYKGREYNALIVGNDFVLEGGEKFESASAAAKRVTGTTVNGLAFWSVKRPQDTNWTVLKALPRDTA